MPATLPFYFVLQLFPSGFLPCSTKPQAPEDSDVPRSYSLPGYSHGYLVKGAEFCLAVTVVAMQLHHSDLPSRICPGCEECGWLTTPSCICRVLELRLCSLQTTPSPWLVIKSSHLFSTWGSFTGEVTISPVEVLPARARRPRLLQWPIKWDQQLRGSPHKVKVRKHDIPGGGNKWAASKHAT